MWLLGKAQNKQLDPCWTVIPHCMLFSACNKEVQGRIICRSSSWYSGHSRSLFRCCAERHMWEHTGNIQEAACCCGTPGHLCWCTYVLLHLISAGQGPSLFWLHAAPTTAGFWRLTHQNVMNSLPASICQPPKLLTLPHFIQYLEPLRNESGLQHYRRGVCLCPLATT